MRKKAFTISGLLWCLIISLSGNGKTLESRFDKILSTLPTASKDDLEKRAEEIIQDPKLLEKFQDLERDLEKNNQEPEKNQKKNKIKKEQKEITKFSSEPIKFFKLSESIKFKIYKFWELLGSKNKHDFCFCDIGAQRVFFHGEKIKERLFSTYLKQLDKPKKQVKIEARLVLIDKNLARDVGINWSVLLSNKQKIISNLASNKTESVIPILLEKLGSIEQVDAVLKLGEKAERIKTLLKPSLLSLVDEEASLLEGEVIPIESVHEDNKNGKNKSVKTASYKDVGISLKVTPRVYGDSGDINLELYLENSYVKHQSERASAYPTIVSSRCKSHVRVKNNGLVVLGGIVKNSYVWREHRVPFLSKIPVIGLLFRGMRREKRIMELVLVLQASFA